MSTPGFNTFHGFDNGPPPPNPGASAPQYPVQYYQQPGMAWPQPQPQPQATYYPTGQPYYPTGQAYYPTQPYPPPTFPTPPPTDPTIPGIHIRNQTGGTGLLPGYNYLFPSENVPIHIFRTKVKPWQQSRNSTPIFASDSTNHSKLMVPCNATVKELMLNLGCTNQKPEMNVLYEIVEKGNGEWSSGLRIHGGDKDRVKLKISQLGWAKDRTGAWGAKPVVWLWVTKDGK